MGRTEAQIALSVALLMISAGLTWKFGAYGLIAGGALVVLFVALMPAPKPPRRGDGK